MTRSIFIFIFFFGLYPALSEEGICIAGINKLCAQNTSYLLQWYLEKKDGAKFYYLPSSHNCGCAVIQYTQSGEFVQYIYATQEYIKQNPGFKVFLDSGGMALPPVNWEKRKSTSIKKQQKKKTPVPSGDPAASVTLLLPPECSMPGNNKALCREYSIA